MSISAQSKRPSQRHVYHLPLSVLYLPCGTLIFTFFLTILFAKPLSGLFILIMAGSFGGMIAIVALLAYFGVRLETSTEGVVFYGLGYRVRTSWENVRGIGMVVQNGRRVEALLLGSEALEISRWLRIGLAVAPAARAVAVFSGRYYAGRSLNLSEYSHVISVGFFKPDWNKGRLYADVRRYAPQAFEEAKKAS